MRKRQISNAMLNDGMGPEPTWENQNDLSLSEFKSAVGKALNWYNYFYEKKDAKRRLVTYLKKNGYAKDTIESVSKAPEWSIGSTIVALVRMREKGLERTEEGANSPSWFENRLQEIVKRGNEQEPEEVVEEKATAVVISIKDRMRETACNQTEPIEDAIEEHIKSGYKTTFDTFSYLTKNQIKGNIARIMLGFYKGEADELEEALLGKDEQLVEGYSHFKKPDLKRFAQFMRKICDDLERHIAGAKATRKPRKKKIKSASQVISKLKYAKGAPEFKLTSVPAEKIVGAQQLWVFNAKYRTLGVYNAIDRGGLTVKGTTILNFDEATSIKKKLRKPDEVLQRCLTGGKVVLRKLMDEIKTTESSLNGRINEETVLVRVE